MSDDGQTHIDTHSRRTQPKSRCPSGEDIHKEKIITMKYDLSTVKIVKKKRTTHEIRPRSTKTRKHAWLPEGSTLTKYVSKTR